jgi:four helix bundle protein
MRDHRSLEAWKEARFVAGAVLDLSRDHWKAYASALFSQLQKSSLSAQLNIAEGYALGSRPAFAHHLRVAYGSSVETCDILELARDKGVIPVDSASEVLEHNRRSQKLTLGLYKRYRREE